MCSIPPGCGFCGLADLHRVLCTVDLNTHIPSSMECRLRIDREPDSEAAIKFEREKKAEMMGKEAKYEIVIESEMVPRCIHFGRECGTCAGPKIEFMPPRRP